MIGRILGGRYEIREKIGSGGMADVYKAYCIKLNRFVAVKVLKDQYNVDREFVSRFELESQAAASLSHNNIVSVYDVGYEDGIHYIVMELLDGITLKEYIKIHGMLPWTQALDFSIQICDAMDHAHRKGIVHRDIKPQNIMVTDDNVLKVMDFGIARTANKDVTTDGTTAIGSVHYISPEQARGGYVDASSDIYSMGVVMYEMLTGRVPFDGDSHVSIALMHMRKDPVPPCDLVISIPYELQAVCLRAMAKNPAERFADAGEMLSELRTIAAEYSNDKPAKTVEDYEDYISSVLTSDRRDVPVTHRYKEENQMPQKPKKTKKETKNEKKAKLLVIIGSVLIVAIFVFVFVRAIKPDIFSSDSTQLVIDKYPNLVGRKIEDVKKEYKNDKTVTIKEAAERVESVDYEEEGYIVKQTPKAGKKVTDKKITITVTVSKGNKDGLAEVPDFTGKHYENAVKILDKYNIEYEIIPDESSDQPEGYIISQTPKAGKTLTGSTKVKLYVNMTKDDEKLERVPRIVGLDSADAKSEIESSGFTWGSVTEQESSEPKGTVISQSPDAGTEIKKGYRINVVVSSGEAPKKNTTSESIASTQDQPELNTVYLTVDLPTDREKVDVTIKIDGKEVFNQNYSTSSGTADVRITGSGTKNVEVYFDGELARSENVNFDE
ncbi:MAG: Stk1 family PASTA domain-containing Ser/Thr kinase [Clostridia bacterium]|nr:Stk1 family PASTA domain-containing Ser/Thr kinase [Clostridia bacterium]